MITYKLNLSMDPGGISPVIHVGQYDDDYTLVFNPFSAAGVFSIEPGSTAEIRGTKLDGNGYSADAEIEDGLITVAGDKQMTAIAGMNVFEIVIKYGDKVLSSTNFCLAVEHAAMDAETVVSESVIKEIGESVNAWLDEHGAGAGLTESIKVALLQIAEKVAYIDEHGQDYYDALESALYPPVDLVSISASFNSGGATIYNTETLDDLKQYLTVTATYSDLHTEEVESYILTGSMSAGTQTITVTYAGKTTTFTVTVAEWVTSISAVYTPSGTVYDNISLNDLKTDIFVTATYADTTTETLSDDEYTLSGTIAEGTQTITVTYAEKTDTFTVTVVHAPFWKAVNITNEFKENTTVNNSYNANYNGYYAYSGTRCAWCEFEILLEAGYTYTFSFNKVVSDRKYGVQTYKASCLTAVQNQTSISSYYNADSGWQSGNYVFTPSEDMVFEVQSQNTKESLANAGITDLWINREVVSA